MQNFFAAMVVAATFTGVVGSCLSFLVRPRLLVLLPMTMLTPLLGASDEPNWAEVISALATVFGVFLAFLAYRSWRTQLLTSRRMVVALNMLEGLSELKRDCWLARRINNEVDFAVVESIRRLSKRLEVESFAKKRLFEGNNCHALIASAIGLTADFHRDIAKDGWSDEQFVELNKRLEAAIDGLNEYVAIETT